MRCKKHPYQAGGGVCATCLRDRLLALEAAQNGDASPPPPAPAPAPVPAQAPPVPPEPLAFPRSVSPYVSRRKSDTSGALRHHPSLLFFRTPQVGPAYGGALEEGDIAYEYEKRRARKFSVLATLFGHHHHHHRSEEKHHHQQEGGAKERKKQFSWFAGIIPRRRKKQQAPAPAASATSPQSAPPRRSSCRLVVSNRGSRRSRTATAAAATRAAARPPPRIPRGGRPRPHAEDPCQRRQTNSMPSGFAVCLSPLVRPSPGRRHRHGVQPPDPGSFSCELRPSPLHSLSSAASVTRCRSRKLADGGRFR
ncbi:unnamed protein product [Miscanthus lutarioriparius]|uniref:Uncharacterized protein n=1 Tax=Miscanthus lutarioriparius TaxID=422564 RepID=A0A811SSV6_9POAL|nr:unnamed protein product [Miscanthus lutarioriparius]